MGNSPVCWLYVAAGSRAPGAIKWTWIINDREIEDLKERVELVFGRMNRPARSGEGATGIGRHGNHADSGLHGRAGSIHQSCWRFASLLVPRGQTDPDDARPHAGATSLDEGLPVPSRSWYHTLTNCLGGSEEQIQVEFHHFCLADDDRLLLCTDGLTDLVPNPEIADILGQHAHPQEAVQTLIDLVLERGGTDNITVVLGHYTLKGPDKAV